ncbi:Uncharacterised protein [Chlamydia trachomatis]|nr:Uncharacterised protein [Chlamydia trachomatis]
MLAVVVMKLALTFLPSISWVNALAKSISKPLSLPVLIFIEPNNGVSALTPQLMVLLVLTA